MGVLIVVGRGVRARAHACAVHACAYAWVFTRDYYITVQYVQVSKTGLNWIYSLFNAHCIHVAEKLAIIVYVYVCRVRVERVRVYVYVRVCSGMANFNYIWQGGSVFPSTQMQFGQHSGVQPGAQVPVQICQQAANGHGVANLGNHDIYLKVLSPENKNEYKTVTLRASTQCDGLNPENMEIGYFVHSKNFGLTVVWISMMFGIAQIKEKN